ncbi:phospholipase D-like domain-containing protein [Nonomuraea jabiensis]|uniref:phospholipase D-like domain-containing protein n=1 Tax=Nonomuraea jabiensis TaxID=882448 RepID=UPI003427486C
MSLRELVPLADLLAQLAGGYEEALRWTHSIRSHGINALRNYGVADDYAVMVRRHAAQCGLLCLDDGSEVSATRLSELQVLLDALSAARPPIETPVVKPPLVFTLPADVAKLVPPSRRLDLLVEDVIACSSQELHIGGPFWNETGCALLGEILAPAVELRGVSVSFYTSGLGDNRRSLLDLVKRCAELGDARLFRWTGGRPSLMHAKFVISDRSRGYFGSANLTSLGLATHFEIGLELDANQAAALTSLCDALRSACHFVPASLDSGEPIGIPATLKLPGRPPQPALLAGYRSISTGRVARVRYMPDGSVPNESSPSAEVPESWIVG